jgi:hypothetical protein
MSSAIGKQPGELTTDGLFHIKRIHYVLFLTTWAAFWMAGKWFFETGLGQYHATSSKQLARLCKVIFLVTFVAACNLLELMTFEILDLLHPTLRQLAWTLSLALLCSLLNLLIPAVFATSVATTILGIRRTKAFGIGVCCVLIFQICTWSLGKMLTWFEAAPFGITSRVTSTSFPRFLYSQIFLVDLQTSVADIALSGTATAAIIAGFSTVSFPLEQIMVLRGIDTALLNSRERSLTEVLALIAEKKKMLLMNKSRRKDGLPLASDGTVQSTSSSSAPHQVAASPMQQPAALHHRPNIKGVAAASSSTSSAKKDNSNTSKARQMIIGKISTVWDILLQKLGLAHKVLSSIFPAIGGGVGLTGSGRRIRFFSLDGGLVTGSGSSGGGGSGGGGGGGGSGVYYDQILNSRRASTGSPGTDGVVGGDEFRTTLFNEVSFLEQMSEDIYLDIVNLKELQSQAEYAQTLMGRVLRFMGHALSVVAILRLLVGLWHVAGFVLGDTFEGISSQPDVVVSMLSMIVVYLRVQIDVVAWSPLLNCCLVSSLALMQVRAFIGTTQQLARLGFLSTSTEHYALTLAFLAGNYFVASVVLLRTQLPLRYRRGITIALGEDFQFDFFFWLFDFLFVFSSLAAALFLWYDHSKAHQLMARERSGPTGGKRAI